MVILEGADHVKFGMGSVGRMKRMAPSFQVCVCVCERESVCANGVGLLGRMKRKAPFLNVCAYVCVCVCLYVRVREVVCDMGLFGACSAWVPPSTCVCDVYVCVCVCDV